MAAKMQEKLVLIGGGGHAIVVAEAAQAAGFTIAGFLDDAESPAVAQLPGIGSHLGGLEVALPSEVQAMIALGDLHARWLAVEAHGSTRFASVIHPQAVVSPSARMGAGAFVGAGVIVQGFAAIGGHAILNTACAVEHECVVGMNVHVGPRAVLCGRVHVGNDTLIGAGAIVLPNMKIGAACIVGAGAVVREHVPDGAVVVGVPARAVHSIACARG